MSRYFLVATDPLTAAQEKALKDKIPAGIGWWHWLPNVWLVKAPNDDLEVDDIRQWVQEVNKNVRAVVLQVDPITWSARSRKDSKGREMTDWIRDNWDDT